MREVEKGTFFNIQKMVGRIPFNQSLSWFNYTYNKNVRYKFFVDDITTPNIACWGTVHRSRVFGKILVINGDCYSNDINEKKIRDFYKVIADLPFNLIELSNVNLYHSGYEISIRQAGFLRPLSLSVCPLTIIVDILEPTKANRNWKRNVKKATDYGITFKCIEYPTINDTINFCRLFDELVHAKKLTFKLKPEPLLKLLELHNFKMFFVLDKKGVILAGRIIYVSNTESYDIYAANSDVSRTCGATFYMMDQIFAYLKEKNIAVFDFGRIGPGNNEVNSVYDFKKSSGGRTASYNGQWVSSKRKYKELFYYAYLFYYRKMIRY
jgi:hypothetical protein